MTAIDPDGLRPGSETASRTTVRDAVGLSAGTGPIFAAKPAKTGRSASAAYFGMGRMIVAFSANVASPALSLMRYWIFNCLTTPGTGSPPKLSL